MRRFKFRLEELLRIRRHIEHGWEMKLAEATGICARLEGRIRELREDREANTACSLEGILYPLTDLLARGLYAARLEGEIKSAGKELAAGIRERDKVNVAYLAASRDRKVLEKLEERKAAEYYRTQLREEGKALDEIGAGLAVRARTGEKG